MRCPFSDADEWRAAGALVKLSGPGSFHAAVHCATVSAAKRMRTNMGKRRRDGRPQLDHLRVSDSANSLDMDIDMLEPFPASPSAPGTSPPVAQQVGKLVPFPFLAHRLLLPTDPFCPPSLTSSPLFRNSCAMRELIFACLSTVHLMLLTFCILDLRVRLQSSAIQHAFWRW